MSIEVLYQDHDLIAINKPADLLSVPGRGPDKQDCAWRRVQQQFPTARVVHRLDYATSGILLFALHLDAQRGLNQAFQQRLTDKHYIAEVSGQLQADEGSVDLPLRCDWENRPLQIVDFEQGKQALTHWRKLNDTAEGSRVRLHPITGRSHQLRVHMLALGHPIIGDRFYGHERCKAAADRLLLHAEALQLPHPITGKPLQLFTASPF
ncbi:pseudouridine synthase [Pontibacter sp. JAM-7]|uniref:pseudouridine synthase n=1 Tax=Pontibacter sp. JAM-7 TaxID=3366581 RepID=UPI003AF869D9